MTPLAPILATLFLEPLAFPPGLRLAMLLPLAASVSVVYKTIHCGSLREVPLASLVLWITIVVGMLLLGVVVLIAFRLLL